MGHVKGGNRWFWGVVLLVLVLSSAALAAQPTLMAAFFVKGKVGLKWGKVAGVEEYLVYRQTSGGDFVQIGSTTEDKYFDETVEGGNTYVYKIAIVEGGQEVFSGTKSVTIAGSTGAFKAPTWVGLRVDQEKLYLNWDPVPGAVAYNIWRSETEGGPYEVVGTSQGSRHVEKDGLVKGNTYYYVLSAMNQEFDETPQSEERSIKYGMSKEELDAMKSQDSAVSLVPIEVELLFEITTGNRGAELNQPSDVKVNSKGMIYVADTQNGEIHCYENDGNYSFTFGVKGSGTLADGEFQQPYTLFIDNADQVYVSDVLRHDIQVFSSNGDFIRRITIDTGSGNDPLRANGLYVFPDGRLLMTDTGNHRFLITSPDGKIMQEGGGKGGEEGKLMFPNGILVSKDGIISIVDTINCRIQQFEMDGKFVRAFGSSGHAAGSFGRPTKIAEDENGMLWISDGLSGMIQLFTATGEVRSALGSNEDDFDFASPNGICASGGKMFVTQRLRNKVSVFGIKP